jgi:nucleoside-diphosphate-sugar epimerase
VISVVNGLLPTSKPVQANGPMRPDEILEVIADISRARHSFGWEPRVPFRDGLQMTLTSLRESLGLKPNAETPPP